MAIYTITCKTCHREVEINGRRGYKFCSDECRIADARTRAKKQRKEYSADDLERVNQLKLEWRHNGDKPRVFLCVQCHKECFHPAHTKGKTPKYCSDECRVAFARERNKRWKEAHAVEHKKKKHEYYLETKSEHQARNRQWKKTDAGIRCRLRYARSERGKEAQRQSSRKYLATPNGKSTLIAASNRRRAKKKNAQQGLPYKEWMVAMKKQSHFTCYWCKEKKTISEFTAEHIVAIENGGIDGMENICACCKSCNSRKKDITLEDWAKRNGSLPL